MAPVGTGLEVTRLANLLGMDPEELAGLAEQGIQPEKPPYQVREGGSRICFVRDPDDYRIELIERHRS